MGIARCKKPARGWAIPLFLANIQYRSTRMFFQNLALCLSLSSAVLQHITRHSFITIFDAKDEGLYCGHDGSPFHLRSRPYHHPVHPSSVDGMPVTLPFIQIVASCLHARIPRSFACKPKDWDCANIGAFMTWRSTWLHPQALLRQGSSQRLAQYRFTCALAQTTTQQSCRSTSISSKTPGSHRLIRAHSILRSTLLVVT